MSRCCFPFPRKREKQLLRIPYSKVSRLEYQKPFESLPLIISVPPSLLDGIPVHVLVQIFSKAFFKVLAVNKAIFAFIEENLRHIKFPVKFTNIGLINDEIIMKQKEKYHEDGTKKLYKMNYCNMSKQWKKDLIHLQDNQLIGARVTGHIILERTTMEQVPRIISLFKNVTCAGFHFEKVQQHVIEAILKDTKPYSIQIDNKDIGNFLNRLELLIYDKSLTQLKAFREARRIKLNNFDSLDYSFLSDKQTKVELLVSKKECNQFLRKLSSYNGSLPQYMVIKLFRGEGHCDLLENVPVKSEWSCHKLQSQFKNSPLCNFSVDLVEDDKKQNYYGDIYSLELMNQKIVTIGHLGDELYLKTFPSIEEMILSFFKFGCVLFGK